MKHDLTRHKYSKHFDYAVTNCGGWPCVSTFFSLLKLILRLCVVCWRILQQKSTGVISGEGVIRRFSTNCHCAKKCQIETGCRFFQGQSHIFPRRHLQMLRQFQQDQRHGRYASKWQQNEHGESHHTSIFLRPSSGTEMLLMWFSMPPMFLQPTRLCKGTNRWYNAYANPSRRCSQKTGLLFDVCFDVCFNVYFKCMF